MHALIAIDSFKNSITSIQANRIVAKRFAAHGITATQVAIADGGEGTVAAWLANHAGGQAITASTVDLAQRPVTATYGYFATEKMAVIEVAAASGIQFVTTTLTPLATNTYGTGLLIKDAIERGARQIILGLGGSGTVDGGAGILRALGYRFWAADGQELSMTGADLSRVTKIDDRHVLPQLAEVSFISAADVTNPLTGPNGAAKIFGPQKGLPVAQIQVHDAALAHYMTVA
ncbi:glycerate kinase, partial [Lactiplantibacillus plantarum 2165]